MELARLLELGRTLRVAGFDDAPFRKRKGGSAPLVGVICADTRFEGMVWGTVRQDGWGATDAVAKLLVGGKFLPQVHLVILDGVAFGGFNIVDLPRLARTLDRPCVTVMRRQPDLAAIDRALSRLSRPAQRRELIARAGPIHHHPPFVFQVQGAEPDVTARALSRLTDRGHVPEALRLAHLIGSAVIEGESSRRA